MKLIDFIVCDDIRRELGDKLSFMGVFGDSIKLQIPKGAPRPVSFRIAMYLRILIEDGDSIPDGFKATVHVDNKEFAKIEGNIGVSGGNPKILGFVLPITALQVADDTTLSFEANFFVAGKSIMEVSLPYDIAIQVVEVEAPLSKKEE